MWQIVKWGECKWHTFWMSPCFICLGFFVILFYIERKWLLMRHLATILPLMSKLPGKFQRFNAIDKSIEMLTKISIKMKNCKLFCKTQIASHLKEIIQPFPIPPPPDKTLLRLWKKNFLKEIFRNIQTFAFKALQECSSWASRNGAVQYFFCHQTETWLLENF